MDQKESNFSSESSYARPVFATPKEEVETGNVKLETSVENKPRYAVPSVSVKAEEKPTVSVTSMWRGGETEEKEDNDASSDKKEEPVKAEVGSSN
ncbi:hypothetical protein D5086_009727 [Populus alba]|uniref:Uncharacterized protein n=1 Tax=Populus alba TaxID=43335 RepID=A0ACC4C9Z2_POPAL